MAAVGGPIEAAKETAQGPVTGSRDLGDFALDSAQRRDGENAYRFRAEVSEKGDPAAQFGLGAHYAIGDGVKLDNAEAARWFIKAAEQGHVIAQDTMGAYYWAGRGVPKDLRKAYFWSLLGRAGNNETSKYRIVALNALLSREEIEAARQDAERWIRERTLAAKSSSK